MSEPEARGPEELRGLILQQHRVLGGEGERHRGAFLQQVDRRAADDQAAAGAFDDVLHEVAVEHALADVARQLGTSSDQISVTRARLIDKGLVDTPARGELEFTVPGFAEFILGLIDPA